MDQAVEIELLSEETREKIDRWLEKFPPERRRSGTLYALRVAQEQAGWLFRVAD